jgi:hypothetical protein
MPRANAGRCRVIPKPDDLKLIASCIDFSEIPELFSGRQLDTESRTRSSNTFGSWVKISTRRKGVGYFFDVPALFFHRPQRPALDVRVRGSIGRCAGEA